MPVDYKDLATIYHMDPSTARESNIQKALQERRLSPSSFDLGFSLPTGDLFLAVPRELSMLTQNVLRRERSVSSLMRSLPGIAGSEVLRSLVIDEVVTSNDIENIRSTRTQIDHALRTGNHNSKTHKRFREFARLYLDLSYSTIPRPETPEDIRVIYDQVMSGEELDCPPDGKLFRKNAVFVHDGMREVHRGVAPESAIIDGLQDMLALVNSSEVPELYSALTSHYIFEYIHPFYDGNGRTGRYLLSMFLEAPLSKPTALSLSRVIAENKHLYYQAFQNVQNPLNHGEATFFVITMHELILRAQDELIERLTKNVETFTALSAEANKLAQMGAYSQKEADLLFGLAQQRSFGISPDATLDTLAEYAGIGTQQTRKYLAALEKQGAVVKTRGRNPLLFALTDEFAQKHFPSGAAV
ncbi:Fic family protein [Eggerthellaceae bacterium zg-893]|nr:Fic family protein [Eggerthellaceae bacterium zg-893]